MAERYKVDLLQFLNDRGAAYCLLDENQDGYSAPDLTILLDPSFRKELDDAMRARGYIHWQVPCSSGESFHTRYDPIRRKMTTLQFVYAFCGKSGLHWPTEEDVLSGRQLAAGRYEISPEDKAAIKRLCDESGLRPFTFAGGSDQVRHDPAARQPFSESFKCRECVSPVLKLRCVVFRLFRLEPIRPGLSVAFIGVDGSGKSTIAHGLGKRLNWPLDLTYVYGGRGQFVLPGTLALWNVRKDNLVFRMLYLLFRQVDKFLKVGLVKTTVRRGKIVCVDRWFHDLLALNRGKEGSVGSMVKKCIFLMSPKVDEVIWIDTSTERIVARRSEMDPAIVDRDRVQFERLFMEFGSNITRIKNNGTLEELLDTCALRIWGLLHERIFHGTAAGAQEPGRGCR
jgi:thymidylate kinase